MNKLLLISAMFLLLCCWACQNDGNTTDGENATEAVQDTSRIYDIVEEIPRFPGCESLNISELQKQQCAERKLLEYIYQSIEYPENALKDSIEGRVVVRFVVERDGSISTPEILKGVNEDLDEEAKRVVLAMNDKNIKWRPGRLENKNVRAKFTLPINFKMTTDPVVEQNIFVFHIFCRDFAGDFFQRDFLHTLAEQDLDENNFCMNKMRLKNVKIKYGGSTVQGTTWKEVRSIFRKAQVGGTFNLEYTIAQGGVKREISKVLMVE